MTTPLSGAVILAIVNLCTKFEVPSSIHYENKKGSAKYRKWRQLRVTQGHWK